MMKRTSFQNIFLAFERFGANKPTFTKINKTKKSTNKTKTIYEKKYTYQYSPRTIY